MNRFSVLVSSIQKFIGSLEVPLSDRELDFLMLIILFVLMVVSLVMFLVMRCRKRLLNVIQRSYKAFENVANNINGGVITITNQDSFPIGYSNHGFFKLIGQSKEQFKNEGNASFLSLVQPKDQEKLKEILDEPWYEQKSIEVQVNLLNQKKGYIPILIQGTVSEGINQKLEMFAVLIDMSKEKEYFEKIEDEREMYRLLVDDYTDMVFYMDCETREICWTKQFQECWNQELPISLVQDEDRQKLYSHIFKDDISILENIIANYKKNKIISGQKIRIRGSNGEYCWYQIHLRNLKKNGKLFRLVGRLMDVDKQVKNLDAINNALQTDLLTGLYNKKAFELLLDHHIERKTGLGGALIFIDIDNFKNINDRMGHLRGDEVLQDIAEQIKQGFRPEDLVSRFGGDEFVAFGMDITVEAVIEKVEMICFALNKKYRNEACNEELSISASIGVSFYPKDGNAAEQLIKVADSMMYAVKQNGKNGYRLSSR